MYPCTKVHTLLFLHLDWGGSLSWALPVPKKGGPPGPKGGAH